MAYMSLRNLALFIHDYLAGKNDELQNTALKIDLEARGIKPGERIPGFRCPNPRCKRPLYYLGEFGPGCSGAQGGCGLKAPAGKRKPFEK